MFPRADFDPERVALRFWPKVLKTSGCWLWTGTQRNGYGVLWINNRTEYAHRTAFVLGGGVLTAGQVVCHRCDTPLCVRFDHLFGGSRADNNADMDNKGRRRCVGPRGYSHPRAALPDEAAVLVRAMWALGTPQRDIARSLDSGQSVIWQIIHRRGRWEHV